MTTLAQVKRSVRPLIEKNGDLSHQGQWLILKPVRHILRGVVFDRTRGANAFRVKWAVWHAFERLKSFPLNWSEPIRPPIIPGLWEWSNTNVQAELIEEIERHALPILRSIETIDDFLAFTNDRKRFADSYLDLFPQRRAEIDVALGDLASARAICAAKIDPIDLARVPYPEIYADSKTLCALVAADDRPALVRLLHEWEEATIRNLKLEAIYEPTPFPLELMLSTGALSG